MSNYGTIMGFLSSSEINRCHKHSIYFSQSKTHIEWNDIIAANWVNRKLRRKLGYLHQLDLLPITFVALMLPQIQDEHLSLFNELNRHITKAFLDAEDRAIMEGFGKKR